MTATARLEDIVDTLHPALRELPSILLTTPESLEGMLISTRVDRAAWFGGLRAAIADELHAFADSRAGVEALANGLRGRGVRTFVSHASRSGENR